MLSRVPLQARLEPSIDKAFTEQAERWNMSRAALCRWLIELYVGDSPIGESLRVRPKGIDAPPPAPAKKTRKAATAAKKPKGATRAKPAAKEAKTATVCVHGNRGLCLQCAKEKASAEG